MDLRAEEYGDLQRLVDVIFVPGTSSRATCAKLDVVTRAETLDLCADLLEVCESLPPRTYTRQRLCDQLNSIVTARGWGAVYGTVA
ncbi:hypothetical protein [Thermophilibacter sp.]